MTEPRTRRRPASRKGRPTLTRELIAEHALRLAGAEGFPAVTMRRLAEDLRVTVRALYNYVEDRQEVVELAAQLMLSQWEVPELDPERWEDGVRAYCAQMRALYRKFPRALLVSLDEKISVRGVHPARLRNPDAFLGLLRAIGLSRTEALQVHAELALKLFGFALLIDYREPAGLSPVPAAWLTGDLDLPHLTEALAGPAPTTDELFAHITDTLVLSIKAASGRRPAPSASPGSASGTPR
ncbi:TetR/AcrR family transcriptional regulator [Kibdelosporangium phytohabitans]|uniref:TetR family transcriptional regulator n=1 Tax=Kibdelosporangium phytohabitans TaxID=860235 RepID=A0A0N9II23_9PSEU|nr:TetR/AcrR family transcriptional regulator [Kibdelosporangium phytohabitans]ALG14642.1 TetR family transcriptional regulator [Kibdelosporangium phytohabitans]MBE1468298.1 AcrR family transcriptional regulator [Kibdelosporangium phytohabitans]